MSTYIVIPARDLWDELTGPLMKNILTMDGWDRLFLFDNGSVDGSLEKSKSIEDDRVTVFSRPNKPLYAMWGEGWLNAQAETGGAAYNITFLNNDVEVTQEFFLSLNAAVGMDEKVPAVYPDPFAPLSSTWDGTVTKTKGSKRHGGLTGHAFMLRGELLGEVIPLPDARYRWWCGDDEIVANLEWMGYSGGRANGLPCGHRNEATAKRHPWTDDAKDKDMETFRNRWAGRLGWV